MKYVTENKKRGLRAFARTRAKNWRPILPCYISGLSQSVSLKSNTKYKCFISNQDSGIHDASTSRNNGDRKSILQWFHKIFSYFSFYHDWKFRNHFVKFLRIQTKLVSFMMASNCRAVGTRGQEGRSPQNIF